MENSEPVRNQFQEKDLNLVGKLNVISELMSKIPEPTERKKVNPCNQVLKKLHGSVMRDHPEEKRILPSELSKLLYLNN